MSIRLRTVDRMGPMTPPPGGTKRCPECGEIGPGPYCVGRRVLARVLDEPMHEHYTGLMSKYRGVPSHDLTKMEPINER